MRWSWVLGLLLGGCVPAPHFDQRALANARRWLLGALLGAVLFLGACVPRPHYSWNAPEVEGVVLRNGVPAEGVSFRFLSNLDPKRACSGNDFSNPYLSKTDDQGRFQGDSVEEFHFFISIGYYRNIWSACFFFADGSSYYYSEDGSSVPRKQIWRCEIKSDEPMQGLHELSDARRGGPGEAGTCVVEDVP